MYVRNCDMANLTRYNSYWASRFLCCSIGGCDIMLEMYENGELKELIEKVSSK